MVHKALTANLITREIMVDLMVHKEIMVRKGIRAITAHKVLTDSSHITKAVTEVEVTDLDTAVLRAGAVEAKALTVNNPVTRVTVRLKAHKTAMEINKTRNGEVETKALTDNNLETKLVQLKAIMDQA
jgi:hypothetical protein